MSGLISKISNAVLCALVLCACGATSNAETVFITGANSGLGLELSRQFAERGWTVIATHRRDSTPETLVSLMDEYDNVRSERMDVTEPDQIKALAEKLADEPIDILINNAGVITLDNWERGLGAGQRFDDMDFDQFLPMMAVNAKGAMMVTEAFYPNVVVSDRKLIIAMSSSLGSISDPPVETTNVLWYGATKAALNKLMVDTSRTAIKDGVAVIPMHPGAVSVNREEGEPIPPGMLDAPYAISEFLKTVDGLTLEDTGKFIQYDGKELAW